MKLHRLFLVQALFHDFFDLHHQVLLFVEFLGVRKGLDAIRSPLTQPRVTRVAPVRVANSLQKFIAADSNPSAVATAVANCKTCWCDWAIICAWSLARLRV